MSSGKKYLYYKKISIHQSVCISIIHVYLLLLLSIVAAISKRWWGRWVYKKLLQIILCISTLSFYLNFLFYFICVDDERSKNEKFKKYEEKKKQNSWRDTSIDKTLISFAHPSKETCETFKELNEKTFFLQAQHVAFLNKSTT
jgi:hypothetical protein